MPLSPLKYGTVKGRFIAAVADTTADEDDLPDAIPLTGKVTFRPDVQAILLAAGTEAPVTVMPAPITAQLDSQGYLTLNGKRGVKLIATDNAEANPTNFTYTVELDLRYQSTPVKYPSWSIQVPADRETDLTLQGRVPAASGTAIIRGASVTSITANNGVITFGLSDSTSHQVSIAGNIVSAVDGQSGTVDLTNKYAAVDENRAPDVLYVNYQAGNDSNTGASWKKAKKTIQAATDAATAGSRILLAPGNHVVGSGVVVEDSSKALTIEGAVPVPGRGHAAFSANGGVHITSGQPAGSQPDSLLRIGTAESRIVNGWTFKNFYINADSIAPGGSAFRTLNLCRVAFEDVASRCLDTVGALRYLIQSGGNPGGDASWWSLSRVNVTGLGLAHSRQGNYWTFHAVNVHGNSNRPAGPALDLDGSQHNLNGLNFETWVTAIRATGCRGLQGMGIMGENVSTMLHMVECRDSVITFNSSAAIGASEVLDENGSGNTVIGGYHRKTGTTKDALTFSNRGQTFTQTAAGSANLIYGTHPVYVDPGVEVLPQGMHDIASSAPLTAEYWDGSAWLPWAIDTTALTTTNPQGVTVDATHKRVRFRTPNLSSGVTGLAYIRARQSVGTASKYTFRILNWAGTTVTAESSIDVTSPAQTRGVTTSFGPSNAMFEAEIDFGLTGEQTATVSRLHLFTPSPASTMRGKSSRGPKGPEGVIEGTPGDEYHCTGVSRTDASIGRWIYPAGATDGTAGWIKLQPDVLTSPNGTKYRLAVTDSGALTTTTL